jgi:fatty-acid peroxygenase
VEPFVHEVRRYYPFFPAIAGSTCADGHWGDVPIPAGRWILLDLYGTNRHPDAWESPSEFRPERFAGWPGDPFTFVAQGGGDHAGGHRCPGEWMTIALVARAVRALTRDLSYRLPPQDLGLRRSHLPPRPKSGVVIREVASLQDVSGDLWL